MREKDEQVIEKIIEHYSDICETLAMVKDYDDFIGKDPNQKVKHKSILFDVVQIGENITKLSADVKDLVGPYDIHGIISVRNIIVHGYGEIRDPILWSILQTYLPNLINTLRNIEMK